MTMKSSSIVDAPENAELPGEWRGGNVQEFSDIKTRGFLNPERGLRIGYDVTGDNELHVERVSGDEDGLWEYEQHVTTVPVEGDTDEDCFETCLDVMAVIEGADADDVPDDVVQALPRSLTLWRQIASVQENKT